MNSSREKENSIKYGTQNINLIKFNQLIIITNAVIQKAKEAKEQEYNMNNQKLCFQKFEIKRIFLILALAILAQPISIPFSPIIEKGLRVSFVEMNKKAEYHLLFNITFLAIDSGHISWGNYSLGGQDGNNFTVLPMMI